MSTRREFLRLLGTIPLALGLRWPVIEPEPAGKEYEELSLMDWELLTTRTERLEPEPAWEGYVERITVTTKEDVSKTIYVWPYGDDANDGLNVQGPKRTIAAAVDVIGTNDIVVHFGG